MKKIISLFFTILLSACNNGTNNKPNSNNVVSSTSSVLSTLSEDKSSVFSEQSSSVLPSPSTLPSSTSPSISSTLPSVPSSSSSISITRPSTNPDGSKTLPIASDLKNRIDITDYTYFDFKSSLPTNFEHIYGNNITNPAFYADATGGLKINENSGPRKGFQTAVFNSWLKIEVRIHIGLFYNASHSVNATNPVFTIYGFDENGLIVTTSFIEEMQKTSENNYVRVYLSNPSICYLEIRATNLPYKSSQVYNFGITGLTLKGWPYN